MADITFVNGKIMPLTSNLTQAVLPAFALTAGNTVIVAIQTYSSPVRLASTIEDTAGNTYARCGAALTWTTFTKLDVWVCFNAKGHAENVVTVTLDGQSSSTELMVAQYANLSTYRTQTALATDSEGTDHDTPSVTINKTPALCLGFFQQVGAIVDHSPTAGAGCNARVVGTATNDVFLMDRIALSNGAASVRMVATNGDGDTIQAMWVFDQGEAPAAVDKATAAGKVATQTLSWSHECFGANRALLIGVGVSGSQTVQSATFKGVAMSYLGVANDGVDGSFRVELWGLKNPAAGAAYEILVTLTGTPTVQQIGASISLYDCDQGSPFGTVFTANARTGTAPSIEVTDPETADAVVDFAICSAGFVSSNKTSRVLENSAGSDFADNIACSTAVAASSVTMGYTTNNGAYALAAVRVKKRQNQDTGPASVSGQNAVKLLRSLRAG